MAVQTHNSEDYMRTLFRSGCLFGLLTFAAACHSRGGANRAPVPDWSRAVLTALSSVPFDSLCRDQCPSLVIDSAVRVSPSPADLDVVGKPVIGYLDIRSLALMNHHGTVISGGFRLHPAERDTARVSVAVVADYPDAKLTKVFVTVIAPRAAGVVVAVELKRRAQGWEVTRVNPFEG